MCCQVSSFCRLPVNLVLLAHHRVDPDLLHDPLEVGVWESLVRRGLSGGSKIDRRDFGKSLFFLGSPVFLDESTGTAFLVSTFST